MRKFNKRLFVYIWFPLFAMTMGLWFVGFWAFWIGPLIVSLFVVPLGFAAVAKHKPSWGVLLAFHLLLWSYQGVTNWQLTYASISTANVGYNYDYQCYPSSFQSQCTTSSDCYSTSRPYCYWGTCSSYYPLHYCSPNNPCNLDFSAECMADVAHMHEQFPTTKSYGTVMVTFSTFFLIANIVLLISTMIWLCRTGPRPCCRIPERR